jgi:hypothetical protein
MNGRAGATAALHDCGEASRCAPAERTATNEFERVRALGRATRSAMNSPSKCARSSASFATRAPHGGRRPPEAWLQFDSGGPSPLTEDRQKPTEMQ